jgi:hypothetical protein
MFDAVQNFFGLPLVFFEERVLDALLGGDSIIWVYLQTRINEFNQ